MDVKFLRLDAGNFTDSSLDDFILHQQVTRCWRRVDGVYKLLPVTYVEQWSIDQRRQIAAKIIRITGQGGAAVAAVSNNKIIGFALVDGALFGSSRQYADLSECYVSEPYRRRGIGGILFEKACLLAKQLGARKLYISAHSAEESIAAYKKYGCTFAQEPDAAHVEKEPCDLQLEYDLSARVCQENIFHKNSNCE